MLTQVTERALRALARASEVVCIAEGVVNLLTGVETEGVASKLVGSHTPLEVQLRLQHRENREKIRY